MLRYAMLCYAMLCYAMLCYAMLCCAMLCYAMLCYVMLCYVIVDSQGAPTGSGGPLLPEVPEWHTSRPLLTGEFLLQVWDPRT